MFALIVISSIIGLTVLVYLFFKRYTIVRVNGDSMLPTYKNGQFRIMDRLSPQDFMTVGYDDPKFLEGRIFVIMSPDGIPAIKRLVQVVLTKQSQFLWFEGDNPPVSRDSRQYGFLRPYDVLGEVVTIQAIKKGIKRRKKRVKKFIGNQS